MADPLSQDINLTTHQLRLYGLFCVRWGYLEAEINFTTAALGSLADNDDNVPFRFKSRLTKWRRTAQDYFKKKETRKAALALIEPCATFYEKRNLLMHGRAFGSDHRGVVMVQSDRFLEEIRTEVGSFSASWLRDGAELMRQHTMSILEFNAEHLPTTHPGLPIEYVEPIQLLKNRRAHAPRRTKHNA